MVTKATVRLFSIPQARLLEGWEFSDFGAGFEAIEALLQAGIRPGLLEFGDDDPKAGHDPPASLYLSYEGPEAVASAEAGVGREICRLIGGRELHPTEVQDFWDQRHAEWRCLCHGRDKQGSAAAARRSITCTWPCHPARYCRIVGESLEFLASRGFHVHQTGLWAHAGLFSLVYAGGSTADTLEAHERLLVMAQDAGGARWSIATAWGFGWRRSWTASTGSGLALLRRLKHELDPNAIMNPGKLGL